MKLTPQVYKIALKNKLYSSLKIQFEKQIDRQCFLPKSLETWLCELQICPFCEKTQMKHSEFRVGIWHVLWCEMYCSNIPIGCVYRAIDHGLFKSMIPIIITNVRAKLKHSCALNISYCFTFFLDICVFSNVILLKQKYNQRVKLSGMSCSKLKIIIIFVQMFLELLLTKYLWNYFTVRTDFVTKINPINY